MHDVIDSRHIFLVYTREFENSENSHKFKALYGIDTYVS